MENAQWRALEGEIKVTKDLNPSLVAQSKLCEEMGETPRRTRSLE
jgi:hypothetical protein